MNAQNCVHCKLCDIKEPHQTSLGCRRSDEGQVYQNM
ncbi:4Fe-4S dicluster domain-containing protein [Rhizobium sp. J15]